MIELFEEQVEAHPDNIAVIFGEEELTYGELNQRANQVAHYLRSLGVKEETLVAISLERSFELIFMEFVRIGPLRPSPAHPIQSLRELMEIRLRGGIRDTG